MASPLQISNLRTLRSCGLCIICAKSDEAEVVKKKWFLKNQIAGRDVAELSSEFKGHEFFTGTFKLDTGKALSFYLTYTSRQGIQSFAAEAAVLFTILKPTYAVLVGTCAAISDKGYEYVCCLIVVLYADEACRLGDVIFGEKALNYEEGKWEIENGKPVFRADVKTVEAQSASMGGFIQNAKLNREDWKLGDYISGCAVRLDAQFIFERVAGHVREFRGSW
jgi:hypothetical protein